MVEKDIALCLSETPSEVNLMYEVGVMLYGHTVLLKKGTNLSSNWFHRIRCPFLKFIIGKIKPVLAKITNGYKYCHFALKNKAFI